MGWEASKKSKTSDAYPKSIGETASNENQVIQPFQWERNADRSLISVKEKSGYEVIVSRWKDTDEVSHRLTISTSEPTVDDGEDDDLWFVREA